MNRRPRPAGSISGSDDANSRRTRLRVLALVASGFALILAARLAYIQIVLHDHYGKMALSEHWRQTTVPPRRGDILDSAGVPLATTVNYESLYASTTEIARPERVASALSPILRTDEPSLRATLSKQSVAPTLIQAGLSDDVAQSIKQLSLPGLFFQIEPKRVYPQGSLAGQVLGVVGVDNSGLSGLELQYDADLAGKPGIVVAERDTAGDAIAFGPKLYQAPVDGESLTLTIDRYVQWVAERELISAVRSRHARSGTVMIVEPATGAVLAVASVPSVSPDDPDRYSTRNVALYGIPSVGSPFEPGSLFPAFTVAAAIDGGEINAQSTFTNNGTLSYVGVTINDAVAHPPIMMSVLQALATRSPVGASWAGTKLGSLHFYQVMSGLGLGDRTGIDLPGEARGLLRVPTDLDWSTADLATNSFGQGLTATPIQLAEATAAIANAGIPMKPYVVRRIDATSNVRASNPQPRPPAIRPSTSVAITQLLVSLVDDSSTTEGRLARVPGYAIAGKAGAESVSEVKGTPPVPAIASFVGFAPADHPRFAIVVRIDGSTDGSPPEDAGATVFGSIARQLLSYYQIPPSRSVPANGT